MQGRYNGKTESAQQIHGHQQQSMRTNNLLFESRFTSSYALSYVEYIGKCHCLLLIYIIDDI
jgi:hypothetical protein